MKKEIKKEREKISEKDLFDRATEYLESNSGGAIVAKIILATVALGGIMFAGAVTPNLIRAVEQTRRFGSSGKTLKNSSVSSVFSRLKRDGYIYLRESKDGKVSILLTDKGRHFVYDFSRTIKIKKPLIWDRKWRIVVFDILTKKRREHDFFRRKIKEMGFLQLQKSVWVYPYRCEDEVLFLAKQLDIVECMEIFTAEKMIHRKELEKRFFHPDSAKKRTEKRIKKEKKRFNKISRS